MATSSLFHFPSFSLNHSHLLFLTYIFSLLHTHEYTYTLVFTFFALHHPFSTSLSLSFRNTKKQPLFLFFSFFQVSLFYTHRNTLTLSALSLHYFLVFSFSLFIYAYMHILYTQSKQNTEAYQTTRNKTHVRTPRMRNYIFQFNHAYRCRHKYTYITAHTNA